MDAMMLLPVKEQCLLPPHNKQPPQICTNSEISLDIFLTLANHRSARGTDCLKAPANQTWLGASLINYDGLQKQLIPSLKRKWLTCLLDWKSSDFLFFSVSTCSGYCGWWEGAGRFVQVMAAVLSVCESQSLPLDRPHILLWLRS